MKLLIKRFHPKLVKSLRHYTRSREPVEDLAQECWYSIISQLGEVSIHISFDAWALCIARRRAIDWIREQQRSRNHRQAMQKEATEVQGTDMEKERDEKLLREIQAGILKLPATQRIVLNMFYREGLNLHEIAEILGISEGTVKSRLFYAREKLKEIITNKSENSHETDQ